VLYRAIGLVSLWGSVVEGETGWRATFAYPKRIFLPRSERGSVVGAVRTGLSDYGVPVELLDEADTPAALAVRRVARKRRRRRATQSW
jgi:hypothetical protein